MNKKALRRIPLEKLLDLKVDFAFKQLFGSEQNKHITVVFLNAILQKTGRDNVQEIFFKNNEFSGEFEEDKQSRLDIVVKTQLGEYINIEMQLTQKESMFKRTLYYWAGLYRVPLKKGQGYNTLNSTITINICNYTLIADNPHYHSTYHLYEDSTQQRLLHKDDVLEIHFIEINKFLEAWFAEKIAPLDDILVRWLMLLGAVDARKHHVYNQIYKELEELAMKDKNLRQAFSAWEELSQTPESRIAYESRLKYILDEEAGKQDAHAAGYKEGIEQGIEQTAINMLKKGFADAIIAEVTALPLEKIRQLRKQR
ncbi:Rpn family recombination-promoting nuclease/putative transposase [Metasolibacillus sp. FSL K6-0083]|uniref:Rpn family recombination-promoting nuclease/putative transposase n=1 Tax=Metasolibacillus sp. FSL K6-0083 TaxID=2921416 RepID=UPI00315AB585